MTMRLTRARGAGDRSERRGDERVPAATLWAGAVLVLLVALFFAVLRFWNASSPMPDGAALPSGVSFGQGLDDASSLGGKTGRPSASQVRNDARPLEIQGEREAKARNGEPRAIVPAPGEPRHGRRPASERETNIGVGAAPLFVVQDLRRTLGDLERMRDGLIESGIRLSALCATDCADDSAEGAARIAELDERIAQVRARLSEITLERGQATHEIVRVERIGDPSDGSGRDSPFGE